MEEEIPKEVRLARVEQAFRPATPVDVLELFAGREMQRVEIIGAVSQPGLHVALYGERGVGKTSLVRIVNAIFKSNEMPSCTPVLVNCQTEDTFTTLWRNIFRYLGVDLDALHDPITPEDVRFLLEQQTLPTMIAIDELDRFENDDSLSLLADTVKTLSDNGVRSTLVLVGVAKSIGELVGEHESIMRNLRQIGMPRMSYDELGAILNNGTAIVGVSVEQTAKDRIISLSEGLPHYTHLLGYGSFRCAVQNDRRYVTESDIDVAIGQAVEGHLLEARYHDAVRSSQPGNLFQEVLLACAVAEKNNLGYFTSSQVRGPLSRILSREIEIPAFSHHMREFQDPMRGSILRREGKPRAYSYQFTNPMIQPYVVMKAIQDGLTNHGQVESLRREPNAAAVPPPEGHLFDPGIT